MKFLLISTWIGLISLPGIAQQRVKDSLFSIIIQRNEDTTEVNTLVYAAMVGRNTDSVDQYGQQALALAKKIKYKKGEAHALLVLSDRTSLKGNFGESIRYSLDALSIYKSINDPVGMATAHLKLQGLYYNVGDYRTALSHSLKGVEIARTKNVIGFLFFPGHHLAPLFDSEIAQVYVLMGKLDSALFYVQRSIDQKALFNGTEWYFPIYLEATIQTMNGNYTDAISNFKRAYPLAIENNTPGDTIQISAGLSTLFKKMGKYDSSIHYARAVVAGWTLKSEYKNIDEALNNLAQVYKIQGKADSALKYVELSKAIKDSIFTMEKNREIQKATFAENLKQQQLIADQLKYINKIQRYSFFGGVLILVVIVLILWRSSLLQKKASIKIKNAYTELKTTQHQLVQSEKMASLGELTAGIAHEIQNPLNFVNNFSEVNTELIEELKAESQKPKAEWDELLIKEALDNLKDNEQKIVHHGKRADAIVKSMLQHSRTSSGKKEITDINALCDEYLRLAYHGLRAKDKSFNAKFETKLDLTVPKINLVPQDIGRAILNLINNAFYAVSEKQKAESGKSDVDYEPTVTVKTNNLGDKIEISVKDNGNGISDAIKEKIFQPFFTTKPTGQGTGLGLSLAYDIVTKGHGGEMKVETKQGEGSEFIIQLPVKKET